MLSFNFAGKNSYDDYSILISQRPVIPSLKRRVSTINISGRNSNLRFDEKTYDDITLTVECSVKDRENIVGKIDDIAFWLFEAGESDLIFSFQQVYKYFSEFPIIFNCRPFKYAVENNIVNIIKTGTTINNPGTVELLPNWWWYKKIYF